MSLPADDTLRRRLVRLAPQPFLGSRRWRTEIWNLLIASDPGLLRLRLGLRAALAVGVSALLMRWLAPAIGIVPIVAMLLGGIIGLNGAFLTSSRGRLDAARTVAGVPVSAAATVTIAAALNGHRLATLIGFVVVMVVATFMRRFGPRWFNYGMVGWLTYFFVTFVHFPLSQVGAVIVVIVVAAACVLLAAIAVPDRPAALLRSSLRAFDLRLDSLLATIDEGLVGDIPVESLDRRLHGASFRLVEAALIVDGHLAQPDVDDPRAPAVVRHNVLDAELAAEELAGAAHALVIADDPGSAARHRVRAVIHALRERDDALALRLARELEQTSGTPGASADAVRGIASAVPPLIEGLQHGHVEVPPHVRAYQPAAALFLGNLPGAMPSAVAAITSGRSRWSRLPQNTRLCLQVAVATSLTVAAGDLLSPRRYYWAVLACFLALTGTFTTGEIIVKGSSRVIGTLAGLVAATVAVHFTGQNTTAIVAVMLVCVFLGLYFFRVSYAVMAFAVTTVMGELYNVLHEFSEDLLLLRVAETALGAAIGIAVALVLLPVRTADVVAAARDGFLGEIDELLAAAERRLGGEAPQADLFLSARKVDAALHQLALVARPAGGATLLGLRSRRAMQRLGRYSHVAFLARAAAVEVAESSTVQPPGATAARARELTDELAAATQELRETAG